MKTCQHSMRKRTRRQLFPQMKVSDLQTHSVFSSNNWKQKKIISLCIHTEASKYVYQFSSGLLTPWVASHLFFHLVPSFTQCDLMGKSGQWTNQKDCSSWRDGQCCWHILPGAAWPQKCHIQESHRGLGCWRGPCNTWKLSHRASVPSVLPALTKLVIIILYTYIERASPSQKKTKPARKPVSFITYPRPISSQHAKASTEKNSYL